MKAVLNGKNHNGNGKENGGAISTETKTAKKNSENKYINFSDV
jgi:hypothetical protein